jgi:hypothetical protein
MSRPTGLGGRRFNNLTAHLDHGGTAAATLAVGQRNGASSQKSGSSRYREPHIGLQAAAATDRARMIRVTQVDGSFRMDFRPRS